VGLDCVISGDPSPKLNVYDTSRSHASGSFDPEASKATVSGVRPLVGMPVNAPAGGALRLIGTEAVPHTSLKQALAHTL
jgi:hypothetical protein